MLQLIKVHAIAQVLVLLQHIIYVAAIPSRGTEGARTEMLHM